MLGATEGVLVVAVLIMLVGDRVGRDHPAIADSRTLAVLEHMELVAQEAPPVDVDVAESAGVELIGAARSFSPHYS